MIFLFLHLVWGLLEFYTNGILHYRLFSGSFCSAYLFWVQAMLQNVSAIYSLLTSILLYGYTVQLCIYLFGDICSLEVIWVTAYPSRIVMCASPLSENLFLPDIWEYAVVFKTVLQEEQIVGRKTFDCGPLLLLPCSSFMPRLLF